MIEGGDRLQILNVLAGQIQHGQGRQIAPSLFTILGLGYPQQGFHRVPRRRIQFSRVDPAYARDLFIRHALVEGEWDECMDVVRRACEAVQAHSPRVGLVLKADIREGHTGMLDCWGVGGEFVGEVVLSVPRRTVRIGEALPLVVTLTAGGKAPQTLEVDLRAHYRKADGQLRPKVFKGRQLTLAPGEQFSWTQAVSFKPVSTRALHPGPQGIDVAVNGRPLGWVEVTLKAPMPGV